jgi:hypothetical protein
MFPTPRSILLASIALAVTLPFASAQGPDRKPKEHKPVDLTKLPPASAKQGLTYEKDIRPMLEGTCFKCHGEEKQKGELRVDSLEAILKGGEDGKVVEPGNGLKSALVLAVSQLDEDTAMPPKRRPGGRGGPGGGGGFPGGPGGPGGQGGAPGGPGANQGPRPEGGPGGPGGSGGRPGGPPAKPLTAEQVGIVRAWIDQGAK